MSRVSSSDRWNALRLLKVLLAFALLVPAFAAHPQAAWALDAQADNISFRWAFGAMVGGGEAPKLEAILQDTVLKTGDKLKMMVEMQRKCFVYVIYQNAQGEMSMLFPYTLDQFTDDYETSRKYFIPQKDAWFELDRHIGAETFYLMASYQRLTEVEYLIQQYQSADPDRKREIAGQMVSEIRNVGKQHQEYVARTDTPPAIGGVPRSVERALGRDPSDISVLSNPISATDYYSRTFTIEHR